MLNLIQTPVSQQFDQMWSVNTENGQTQRDTATAAVISQIQSLEPSATNITASLPATGTLRAVVLSSEATRWPGYNQVIYLSYELNGCSAQFTLPGGSAGGVLGGALAVIGTLTSLNTGDPVINVTFDIELLVGIGVPVAPSSFMLISSTFISNANISAGNLTAKILNGAASVLNFLEGQPPPNQATEGTIDASAAVPTRSTSRRSRRCSASCPRRGSPLYPPASSCSLLSSTTARMRSTCG